MGTIAWQESDRVPVVRSESISTIEGRGTIDTALLGTPHCIVALFALYGQNISLLLCNTNLFQYKEQ